MSENKHVMLKFDWEDIVFSPISAVIGEYDQWMNDGGGRWHSAAIIIGNRSIYITVNENTDELCVDVGLPSPKMMQDGRLSLI